MSYESPIKVTYQQITDELTHKFDEAVINACFKVNIDVDRERLLRALRYDRGQYLIGLEDGKKIRRNDWVPVSERLPEEMQWVLCYCRGNQCMILKRHLDTWYEDRHDLLNPNGLCNAYMMHFVLAWMPLPEPYTRREE